MILTDRRKVTVETYRQLPEGAPYQLINGQLVMSPSPKINHQEIMSKIFLQIGNYLNIKPLGRCFFAPVDVHFDELNVFQPDILFVSNKNLSFIKEDGVYGAPDIVIEVLSTGSAFTDTEQKFKIYEKYGVKEYFIVDPEDKNVTAYYLIDNRLLEKYGQPRIIDSVVLEKVIEF